MMFTDLLERLNNRVDEWIEPSEEQLNKVSQEMFNKDYDKLPPVMRIVVKDKATTRFKAGDKDSDE